MQEVDNVRNSFESGEVDCLFEYRGTAACSAACSAAGSAAGSAARDELGPADTSGGPAWRARLVERRGATAGSAAGNELGPADTSGGLAWRARLVERRGPAAGPDLRLAGMMMVWSAAFDDTSLADAGLDGRVWCGMCVHLGQKDGSDPRAVPGKYFPCCLGRG